jgi:hypothetical protein
MPKNSGQLGDLDSLKQEQERFDPAIGETPESEAVDREIPVRFIPATQQQRPAGTSPGLQPGGGGQQGPGNSPLRRGG